MKQLFLLLSFCTISALASYAQECRLFADMKEGTLMEYGYYDKKGKLESKGEHNIVKVFTEGGKTVAEIATKLTPENKKDIISGSYKVTCDGDKLEMDMMNMMSPEMTASFSNMEVTVEGDMIAFPSNLSVGMELPIANTKVKTGMNGMTIMTINITIKDRKVLAKESVTVPAGTFNCYKLTQTTDVKMMGTRSSKTVTWYAEGVGAVKVESYNTKGQLESSQQLLSYKKG